MTSKVLVKGTGAISGFYYVHRGPALGVITTYLVFFGYCFSYKKVKTGSLVNQKSYSQPSSVCDVLPIVPVLFTNSLNKE